MSKKKTTLALELKKLTEYLRLDYNHWRDLFLNGCSDPFWSDGVNINLVRNHILYAKKKLEELLGSDYFVYPIEYYYPEPCEVPSDHVVKDRKCSQGHFTATQKLCYNDYMNFTSSDWRSALEIPR